MEDFTMQGTFTLPSKGLFYGDGTVSEVTLRSMTTNEEMKRLNRSDRGYKVMADVIDACTVSEFPVSSYDMCLADYQFLLHKLREVTYGNNYKMKVACPFCATTSNISVDISQLETIPFDDELYKKYSEFDLPQSKKHIKLRIQTPHVIDDITVRAKEIKKKSPNLEGDPSYLLTLESLIASVDGQPADPIEVPKMVRTMSMMDANYIIRGAQKLSESFGIKPTIEIECPVCGLSHDAPFRITSEFFGPSVDF